MKIGRLVLIIIGATLGSMVAVWWVRKNGFPVLPAGPRIDEFGEPTSWIRLD